MNFRPFRDPLIWVSILELKRLDLCPVLEVQYSRKGFWYLDTRERPINLYSVLSSYWNILNFKPFQDRLVWVSILVRKKLDLRQVLEVHFGRKALAT